MSNEPRFRLGAIAQAARAPEGPLITNDEVAGFAGPAPRPGQQSICVIRRALYELRRCVKELGFKGLRVVPWLWALPPNDRRYYPLYIECVELGVPFLHTGGPHRPAAHL